MADMAEKHIFILDGEKCPPWLSGGHTKEPDINFRCFVNQTECFNRLQNQRCDLLIADQSVPATNSVKFVREVKCLVPWVPILIITENGDISNAVEAIKAGAVDVLERPLEKEDFLKRVKSILQHNHTPVKTYIGKPLSKKEQEILRFILEGKNNKEIGGLLHRSTRTIEVHRRRIMHKLGVNNIIDLVKRTAFMKLDNTVENQEERGNI